MIKLLLNFLLILCYALPAFATAPSSEQLTGKVIEKTWQKSQQSYCQGGSNYYVLQVDNEEVVLNSERDDEVEEADFLEIQAQLADLVGQQVTVTGQFVEKFFSYEDHCPPMAQCIAQDITCHWFRVEHVDEDYPSR